MLTMSFQRIIPLRNWSPNQVDKTRVNEEQPLRRGGYERFLREGP